MKAENSSRRNLLVAIVRPSHDAWADGWPASISPDIAVAGLPPYGCWENGLMLWNDKSLQWEKKPNMRHCNTKKSSSFPFCLLLLGQKFIWNVWATYSCEVLGCSPGCQNCCIGKKQTHETFKFTMQYEKTSTSKIHNDYVPLWVWLGFRAIFVWPILVCVNWLVFWSVFCPFSIWYTVLLAHSDLQTTTTKVRDEEN